MIRKKSMNFLKQFLSKKIRVAEFAITNCCTAKCTFCGIWKQEPKVIISREDGVKAIDKMAKLGVAHITMTGGEPLLNPNIFEFVRHCSQKHIHTLVLNADARLLKEETIVKLKEAHADILCISVDSHDPAVVEKSRGIPGLLGHIEKGVAMAKKHKLLTMASILIWKESHNKLEQLFNKLNDIGFDYISVNYPEISESKVYPLGGETVKLTNKDVITAIEDVIRLKKTGKYTILNLVSSMKNIINYLEHPSKAKFHCYGGSKVLFIDWFFNINPCMHLPTPLGSLWNMTNEDLKMIKCNKCNMSWYRDFSMYFHGLKSIRPIYETISVFNHLGSPKNTQKKARKS